MTDNAGALSSDARTKIENELQAYEKSTGHQIIVYIDKSTGDVPLETWTGETADHWKVGRKGKDDGAVLFLFMADHKVRIEVGYGLESSLTDADSHRIIEDDIVPRMKAGDADGAVSSGVAAMLTTVTPAYKGVTPPPAAAEEGSTMNTGVAVLMIIVIALGFGFLAIVIVLQVIGTIRYGYLVMREGSVGAKRDMKRWPMWGGGVIVGGGTSFGGGGGDFSGGGFSAGGGGFGGGGASGGW
ncbi:MAG TPA: TPM domain-containing protein [Candidatus Cybelea sp.]|nr:TPM domain-containing protein [Candidatus Cybelea sp.]